MGRAAKYSTDRRFELLVDLAGQPNLTEYQKELLDDLRQIEWSRCFGGPEQCVYWFNTWVWTYNPKLVGASSPYLPMDLFPKQEKSIHWFWDRSRGKEDGHYAKSRDIGFTWMAGGYALNRWLSEPGYKCNFGSRKAEYVDRIGDPDSIFEKIRMIYRMLPPWMMPARFNPRAHDRSMLLENPDMGSLIRGESGDDMGRGGRSTDYFFDEFAFVEHADSVDAASVANSECRIFGSTVNGNGNLFYRMAHDGRLSEEQKFRFHWSDDPRKAEGVIVKSDGTKVSWVSFTKARMETHKFASEYDIDYSASVEGICIPARWVEAAKALGALVRAEPDRRGIVGGDVGGGGRAKSVAVARFGPVVMPPESWSDGDTINTAGRMVKYSVRNTLKDRRADKFECRVGSLHYDEIGVGKGVQDALKRDNTHGLIKHGVNVGNPPTDRVWPDGETSKEKFANLKAEAWFIGREAFKNSYELWLHLTGQEGGHKHAIKDCVILPGDKEGVDCTVLAAQLSTVKWSMSEKGKIVIQTKASLAKDGIPSPDHADALMLTYAGVSVVEDFMKAMGVN
jgi:phage terminase large subunit